MPLNKTLLILIVFISFFQCSFNINTPEKKELKLPNSSSYRCVDRPDEGGREWGDSLIFNIEDNHIWGTYYTPNSIYSKRGVGELNFNGTYKLSGIYFDIEAHFEVASNLQVKDTTLIGAYYYQDSLIYGNLKERWSKSDTLHYKGDTLIRSHTQEGQIGDSTFTEFVSDTLVLLAPITWIQDTNITTRDSTIIENRLDSLSYEYKGDPSSEFRLREFYSGGLFEQIGYWIDCKLQ